jgi:predicted small lipoprotein YifL
MIARRRIARWTGLAVLALLLGACGQKGPLYLPASNAAGEPESPTGVPAQAVSEEVE